MPDTTVSRPTPSSVLRARQGPCEADLLARYKALAGDEPLTWQTRYHKLRILGSGGQGVVYLARRQGTDGFAVPVALEAFSPEPYGDSATYAEDMRRMARVAARVALI